MQAIQLLDKLRLISGEAMSDGCSTLIRMLLFLKKKTTAAATGNFAFLHTDMHSHLVPGIDDGAGSLEDSMNMLRGFSALGYRKIITTPHVRPGYFPNTRKTILEGFEKVETASREAEIDLELECAAEYFVDYGFIDTAEEEGLLTFSGNHVLIELSTFSPPPDVHHTIFQLQVKGYQPVLAHPERYVYYEGVKDFQRLKELGCLFQMNIMSLSGHYGKTVKSFALKLLKSGLIDLFGTDCHRQQHIEELQKIAAHKKTVKLMREAPFRNPEF
ncbi:MAG: tyrosine-protein phosphatase [Saprospiraceae bacterium]